MYTPPLQSISHKRNIFTVLLNHAERSRLQFHCPDKGIKTFTYSSKAKKIEEQIVRERNDPPCENDKGLAWLIQLLEGFGIQTRHFAEMLSTANSYFLLK